MTDPQQHANLSPCPSPGCHQSRAEIIQLRETTDYCVVCRNCGMRGPLYRRVGEPTTVTVQRAAALWNQLPRANYPDPRHPGVLRDALLRLRRDGWRPVPVAALRGLPQTGIFRVWNRLSGEEQEWRWRSVEAGVQGLFCLSNRGWLPVGDQEARHITHWRPNATGPL